MKTIFALVVVALAMPCLAVQLTVEAGAVDREGALVSFSFIGRGELTLVAEDGQRTNATSDGKKAWFVLDHLKAGQKRQYRLEMAAKADERVKVTKNGVAMEVTAWHEGKFEPVLSYQAEKTALPAGYDPVLQRGGYISPVFTPSGELLTDDYPPNHKHHHGIWSPWTKTEFEGRHPDFWNMQDKTGRVDPAGVVEYWSGSACGGLRASHTFIDMIAKPEKVALNEEWELNVYPRLGGEKPYYVFDLAITQNAVDSPLVLPKYIYGGLGFRGRREWNGKGDACLMITSEGKNRVNGDETRARWVWVGGKAEGKTMGLGIMCDPVNFRSPQPIRLHPDMPYVCYTPSEVGDWKIEKGKSYWARYRFVARDGELDREEMERLWRDFGEPVKVEVMK